MKFSLMVEGDYACFTRPEMKAERVSYDVITPSAARAIYEAIFWKPAFRWVITDIFVFNKIEFLQIRRNEVGSVISNANLMKEIKGSPRASFFIEDNRTQRASVVLKNVKYRIDAVIEIKPEAIDNNPPVKIYEMFHRRAERGQCFMQPYFGCREFPVNFELAKDELPDLQLSMDLGWMLFDMDYKNTASPNPRFFRAKVENGRIIVPHPEDKEIRG